MPADFEIKEVNNVKGLFSNKAFEKNQVILRIPGKNISLTELKEMSVKDDVLQINDEIFLDMTGKNEFFINHSCNPNCYIKIAINTAFLIALRPISKGDQLFFDYSTTSLDDPETWKMNCNCKFSRCRKLITGIKSLNEKQIKYYTDLDALPKFIKNKLIKDNSNPKNE